MVIRDDRIAVGDDRVGMQHVVPDDLERAVRGVGEGDAGLGVVEHRAALHEPVHSHPSGSPR